MLNKIKNFFLKVYYGIPFGMKGADKEIMGGGDMDPTNTVIGQEVSDERVAKHLLKGEVTQSVEELRYRTYAVEDESRKYEYIGGGVAVKHDEEQPQDPKKRKFTQSNELICESVLQTLRQVGGYGIEKHRFEIDYDGVVRFKIENFATMVDVLINDDEKVIETTLHFNSDPNPYDATSMPFINELKRLTELKSEYALSRNEIASSMKNLCFITYKAYGEDDFVIYAFINGAVFKKIEQVNGEFLVTYTWNDYMRQPNDLKSKYYSSSMDEKYKTKAKKNTVISMVDAERKRYCSACGREVSVYDGDIMEFNGDEVLCSHCLSKSFKK